MKQVILLVLISIYSCSSSNQLTIDDLKKSPFHKLDFYTAEFSQNLTDKIQPIPSHVLNRLIQMDKNEDYKQYLLSNDELEIVKKYFELLPEKFKTAIKETTVGIYFVKNFMGGGMTDFLFDEDGKILTALYFNPETLSKNLTDWITYRDSSPFSDLNGEIRIIAECNSAYKGFIHALIHEASHIYDYTVGYTPFVEPILEKNDSNIKTNQFVNNVWINYSLPIELYNFDNRLEFSSYGLGVQLEFTKSVEVYSNLMKTPFISLYGAKNWAEDFAECFTWYYLKEKLNIDYSVIIFEKTKEIIRVNQLSNYRVFERVKNQFLELTNDS